MRNRRVMALIAAAALALAIGGPVSAHPHRVSVAHQGDGQVLANGQLHGPFVNGVSCGGSPAAYGLETAHHGPDAGTPGNGDGCYMTTGGVAPGQDVANPVIR
ncbi:MAG TPA: hypothetical protein VM427_10565 [Patescibacteria group bacterium]|nr:hypothetical protein [Patescibacteria group bacterium]